MARSSRAPASARLKPARSICQRRRSVSPSNAVPITSGWLRTASSDDADAFLGPLFVDIDVRFGPLVAGPALDALEAATRLRLDPEAISGPRGRRRRACALNLFGLC